MKELILGKGVLEVDCENASILASTNQEAFALIRRNGFGASDSSKVLGVNPFNTQDDLVNNKLLIGYSDEEQAIMMKPSVRMGSDLEPIVLSKFSAEYNMMVYKPDDMYRIKGTPLTVNYDGVINITDYLIPVEAKTVSKWGQKYFDLSKTVNSLFSPVQGLPNSTGTSIQDYVKNAAERCGVPVYYYTQLQQEMMGLDAPFGYLACLLVDSWELKIYRIEKDETTQNALRDYSKALWDIVEDRRKLGM